MTEEADVGASPWARPSRPFRSKLRPRIAVAAATVHRPPGVPCVARCRCSRSPARDFTREELVDPEPLGRPGERVVQVTTVPGEVWLQVRSAPTGRITLLRWDGARVVRERLPASDALEASVVATDGRRWLALGRSLMVHEPR